MRPVSLKVCIGLSAKLQLLQFFCIKIGKEDFHMAQFIARVVDPSGSSPGICLKVSYPKWQSCSICPSTWSLIFYTYSFSLKNLFFFVVARMLCAVATCNQCLIYGGPSNGHLSCMKGNNFKQFSFFLHHSWVWFPSIQKLSSNAIRVNWFAQVPLNSPS